MADVAALLFGQLPDDRQRLLEAIDSYLFLPRREKLIFSLNARLRAFMGQYGALPGDLVAALTPFARDRRIDVSLAGDSDLTRLIGLIRAKLMP